MAFPPATLPTNRVNATPQNNTHPADHNAISAAINDTVGAVQALQTANARQALQAIGSVLIGIGATVNFTFSSLNTAAWGAGPTFTAPSGTSGIFTFMIDVTGPTPAFPNNCSCQITVNTGAVRTFQGVLMYSESGTTVPGFAEMTAGDQVSVQITNNTAAASFFDVELLVFKGSV